MLGHEVKVVRMGTREAVHGTLDKLDATGAYVIVHKYGEGSKTKFLPMHTIMEIQDKGRTPR